MKYVMKYAWLAVFITFVFAYAAGWQHAVNYYSLKSEQSKGEK